MNTICPDAGRLRAWLDREGPAGGANKAPNGLASAALTVSMSDDRAVEEHLVDCDACQETLVALERDADLVATALSARAGQPPTVEETEAALGRLHRRLAGDLAPLGAMNRAPAGSPDTVGA